MNSISSQADMLSRLLDVASLRHRVIAQNVANVNTPGYHRRAVEFESAFGRALEESGSAGALKVQPKVVTAAGGSERADGNNVDMDVEMGYLNKNVIFYKVFSQMLTTQLAAMRSAISGQ